MPYLNSCTVCQNPAVVTINKHIAAGRQLRWIEARYFVSQSAVGRHKKNCLKLDTAAVMASIRLEQKVDVYLELQGQLELLKRMRDAAEEYLTDPNDPLRFCFNPRADEITVMYYRFDMDPETGEVKRTKHRNTLAEMQGMIEEKNPGVKLNGFSVKKTDMRRYILDLVRHIDQTLTQFAKLEGLYTKERDNAETITKGMEAFNFWKGKNPQASDTEIKDAMEAISKGVNVRLEDLEQRLGIEDRTEVAVQ